MSRFLILAIAFVFSVTTGFGQEKFSVEADLAHHWKKYEDDAYSAVSPKQATGFKTVYFDLNANSLRGRYLNVESARRFSLYANGKLILETKGKLHLSIDSLSSTLGESAVNFSIYQSPAIARDLDTKILSPKVVNPLDEAKPDTFFRDFLIVSGLLVIIFFVFIINVHTKLASDYFSIARALSLREAEDNQSHARFAISSNVLFYIFSSVLLGFCLLLLLRNLPDNFLLPAYVRSETFWAAIFQWLKVSFIILVILFTKMLLIFSLSNLFGLRGIAGVHFFNWIRLLLILTGALTTLVFIYYISRGYNPDVYVGMLTAIIVCHVIWIIIVFLKLNNRIEHSMFHLFSYICATEVIPLFISIRILFQ